MSARLRALLAALVVATAALGATIYAGRERNAHAATEFVDSNFAAANFYADLTRPQPLQEQLLKSALQKVEQNYYKPVVAQTLLDGEQKALTGFLKERHVAAGQIPSLYATGNPERDLRLLEKNIQLAKAASGSKATDSELTQAALRGMLNALGDPYTAYLSKAEIDGLQESLKGGNFGGIGVYIIQDQKTGSIIVDPIEGTPAFRSGVKPGDVIDRVNGKSTKGLKLDSVEHMIRGPIGTVVFLDVHPHNGKNPRSVRVTREQIHVPSVHAKMENGVEYVRLADFGDTSYDEVRRAMLAGKERHASGYILDLRNNGGGLLETAVQISSLFVPQGTIVSTISRDGSRESKAASGGTIGAVPLVILVNKYTASASEITAGAIQDYKAGTIVGTKTFGKGVVQSIYSLGDGGALKITTARYVTPLGRDIHHKGIAPDVIVNQPVDPGYIDTAKDRQLATAKAVLARARTKVNE